MSQIYNIFSVVLFLNLLFPNFKFDKLLADRIEGNPGLSSNSKKFVSGTYHQGSKDIMRQQESSVLAIYSLQFDLWAIRNAALWDTNFILDWGDLISKTVEGETLYCSR